MEQGAGVCYKREKPGWRNGLRRGLKIPDPKGFVGPNPTPGTSDMRTILTIRDKDLGFDIPDPLVYEERGAARAIVFDKERKIALLRVAKRYYHKLPGGGIEKGESVEDALRRELLEEIGCSITNVRELGTIEEFRNKFALHQFSYCFLADLVGEKGTPHLEQGEIADGFEPEWLGLEEAIKILESEAAVEDYQGKFIQKRDLAFLKQAKQLEG